MAEASSILGKRRTQVLDERGIALIGADGIWSNVASRLRRLPPPTFRHRTAWRALVPVDAVPAEFRQPLVHLWLGQDAHLVHYPVKSGSLINIVGIVHDEWNETGWSAAGDRAEILRALRALVLVGKGPRAHRHSRSLAQMGAIRSQRPVPRGQGPRHSYRGCRPPDDAFPGAGCEHGDRGCCRCRRHAGEISRRSGRCAARLRRRPLAPHRTCPTILSASGSYLWAKRTGGLRAQHGDAGHGRREAARALRLAL